MHSEALGASGAACSTPVAAQLLPIGEGPCPNRAGRAAAPTRLPHHSWWHAPRGFHSPFHSAAGAQAALEKGAAHMPPATVPAQKSCLR
eukprot:CAMPEP_0177748272 /NCGR_PEP_ID=MMETSP0484_2-20121128/31847_1 /TAXON_ID=354590 /ORGANISM="Rhodomonas lens, Strain RHODO" /LENGTH=88 /DNA_ID=CAMNT_0019263143 /DNA_START=525 /DNA_END=787 /DNA_ORIENTATION=+